MDFATLRAANLSRCARWHPRGLSEWSLSDWFTATMGELGEAANVAKKLNRERDGIAGNTVSEEQLHADLADEIADVAIYLDILAASEGIDLAKAIARKFNATSEKVGFPERLPVGDLRCEHCGAFDGGRSTHCSPPFSVRPHSFSGEHPADKLQAARAEGYTAELQRTGRIA
jgi:NTP pyrophosphatase (non-canonical NTP hydrolase)